MSLTITKVKAKKKAVKKKTTKKTSKAKTPNVKEIQAELNVLGDLYMQLEPVDSAHKKLTKKYRAAFSTVQEWVDNHFPADEAVELVTDQYATNMAAHGATTKIIEAREVFDLLEKIQEGLAWEIMSFGIKDLRQYLTPSQFEAVTQTLYNRARVTKMVPLDDA